MRMTELLDELEERNDLVSQTANDGIWDFDGQSKPSGSVVLQART